jgi:membrane protein implicated in regulation of membrane protease activity
LLPAKNDTAPSFLKTRVTPLIVIGTVAFLAFGAAAYWIILTAVSWLEHISPNVGAALITALAAIGGLLLTQRSIKRKTSQKRTERRKLKSIDGT